jgi:Arc/MetJ family transcription regulator
MGSERTAASYITAHRELGYPHFPLLCSPSLSSNAAYPRYGLTAAPTWRTLCVAATHGGGMATNLAIDDVLLERARRVGKLRTKKETVTQALTEFIQRRRQRKILKALGTIEFRKGWDYKKDRRDRESGR